MNYAPQSTHARAKALALKAALSFIADGGSEEGAFIVARAVLEIEGVMLLQRVVVLNEIARRVREEGEER